MRRAILILLLALPLAGCGPKTVVSILFPTRYGATTVVDFRDGGKVTRQTVVSRCKTVDQSDSIAGNSVTTVTGERHWIRRADGSLWVLGPMSACRWGVKGPKGETAFKPIRPYAPGQDPEAIFTLSQSVTYRYDDPAQPTRLDTWRTSALFGDGADGLTVSAQIAPGGQTPTQTLDAAFPALAAGETISFAGVSAEASQLRNGACPAPDPEAEGPIRIPAGSECRFTSECHRASTTPCHEPLGGLIPEISADYRTVRFSLERRDRAFVGRYLPAKVLAAAGAPGETSKYPIWQPELCLEGVCAQMERYEFPVFYYPRRNIVVEARQGRHGVWPNLVLAREGPVWGGAE